MNQVKMHQFLFGISFTAFCIGLLVVGLAFGASLTGETGFSEHMLFVPGVFCMGMGLLSLYIILLASSDKQNK